MKIFCGDMFEDDSKGVDVDKVKVVELLEVLGVAVPRVPKCQNVYTEKKHETIIYPHWKCLNFQ